MRKSEQESETAEQYEVRWRLDKDADKEKDRGEVDSGVRSADGDGTVGLISTGGQAVCSKGFFSAAASRCWVYMKATDCMPCHAGKNNSDGLI